MASGVIGRDSSLALLSDHLERARAGQGSVVLLAGEAGIGKTSLLETFLATVRTAAEATVVRGRCVEHLGSGEAFLPFLDALGRILASRAREQALTLMAAQAPMWCLQVASATVSPELREDLLRRTLGATRERMLRELVEGIGASAALHPMVLALEDLQWADPSSIDALRLLATRIPHQRLLVVATFRPAEVGAPEHPFGRCRSALRALPQVREVTIGPWALGDVAAFIRARYGSEELAVDVARAVARRSEGNPLFAATHLDFLEASGVVVDEGGWRLARPIDVTDEEMPESLRALTLRLVERLSTPDRAALQCASVLGREFLSGVLAAITDEDEQALEERLKRLVRDHGLLEVRGEEELPDGSLSLRHRFRHGLVQEALYEELVPRRRAALHLQAAAALARAYGSDATRIATLLADHAERGRDFAAAFAHRLQAADNAAALHAHGEALVHHADAADLLERLPAEARAAARHTLRLRVGQAYHALACFDDAAAEFGRMLDEARSEGTQAHEFQALCGLGHALFFGSRTDELAVRAHEALELAAGLGDPACTQHALVSVAQVLLAEGRLAEAEALLQDALGDGRGPASAAAVWLTVFRGFVRYWRAEYAEAARDMERARELGRAARDGQVVLAAGMFLGLCHGYLGHIDEALALFAEGAEMGRRNADRLWLPRIVSHQGWIHRELNALAEARDLDTEALGLARQRSEGWAPQSEALINLSVDAIRGRSEAATDHLRELAELTAAGGTWFAWLNALRLEALLVEDSFRRGDMADARSRAEHQVQRAREVGADAYLPSAFRFLGEVALAEGDFDLAQEHLARAATLLDARPSVFDVWKVHASLARLHEARGDAASAAAARRAARNAALRLAEGVGDPWLRATFLSAPPVRAVVDDVPDGPQSAVSRGEHPK